MYYILHITTGSFLSKRNYASDANLGIAQYGLKKQAEMALDMFLNQWYSSPLYTDHIDLDDLSGADYDESEFEIVEKE